MKAKLTHTLITLGLHAYEALTCLKVNYFRSKMRSISHICSLGSGKFSLQAVLHRNCMK